MAIKNTHEHKADTQTSNMNRHNTHIPQMFSSYIAGGNSFLHLQWRTKRIKVSESPPPNHVISFRRQYAVTWSTDFLGHNGSTKYQAHANVPTFSSLIPFSLYPFFAPSLTLFNLFRSTRYNLCNTYMYTCAKYNF